MKLSVMAMLIACVFTSLSAAVRADDLQLNGIAAREQLRKEYYIGALFLKTPAHTADAAINEAGPKRMVMHISADRWTPMQFAQQWNQMILINNSGSMLNANVMDVLGFTSIPKSDLQAGDELAIELDHGATTVTLNGNQVLHTASPVLFNMLLNTWIGPRPPSTEFKRDMLALPRDKAGVALLSRYDGLQPSDARRRLTAAWAPKDHSAENREVAAAQKADEKHESQAREREKAHARESAEQQKAEPHHSAETNHKTAAAVAAKTDSVAAAPAEAVAKTVAAAPAATQSDAAAEAAAQQRRQALYNQYSRQLRSIIYKHIVYPGRAVQQNREGLVVLRIAVKRDGELADSGIAQSADSLLDRAALLAIKRGAPFPPVSNELKGKTFNFLIPVVFKLTSNKG